MTLRAALLLARPASKPDRVRALLVAGSVAVAGALLLAAARLLRHVAGFGYARYVREDGLRPGVALGAALLAVPVLTFTVQALRVGATDRSRRMSSLRLAGATPSEVRRLAALEGGAAAGLGGLLAGPAYAVLGLLLGTWAPPRFRLLPPPDGADLALWPPVAVLAAVAGAAAGALVHRQVVAEPLGVRRRVRPARPDRSGLALAVAVVLLLGCARWLNATQSVPAGTGLIVAAVLTCLVGGLFLARRTAARLRSGDRVTDLLAGARLGAEPGAAGRVAAVLLVCGSALCLAALFVADILRPHEYELGGGVAFYLAGAGLAVAAILVAAAVAVLALVVAAADQLLDSRRPFACLAALGVDEDVLVRSVARQLAAPAVPAITAGVLATAVTAWATAGSVPRFMTGYGIGAVAVTLLAGAGATHGAAVLAARLLRRRIRAAADPENLRAA
jgi:hypothetical protein